MPEDIARRIEETCKMRGLTVNKLLTDCGLHGRVVDQMKNRGSIPSADKMVKIATYLGVSTEYLVTGNEPTFANNGVAAVQGYNYGHATINGEAVSQKTSEEKQELDRIYAALNPRRRVKLMALAYELEDEKNGIRK